MEEERKEKSARPKSRQSLAHVSSKVNMTTDIAALTRAEEAKNKVQRARGKSLGPGGLEALTETNANAFKVRRIRQNALGSCLLTTTDPSYVPAEIDIETSGTTDTTKGDTLVRRIAQEEHRKGQITSETWR